MKTAKPSVGFDLLFRTGLLQQFFPQMVALAGTEMKEGKGHKDNFYHTLQVLDNVCDRSENLWVARQGQLSVQFRRGPRRVGKNFTGNTRCDYR